ncbi:5229_t:CDS:2, partial [Racocetra persica]
KVLMERSKEEQKRKQFEEWRQSISSITTNKESLYYTVSHSTIEEVESLMGYESSQSKDIDNEFDVVYLSAKYLLDHLEQNTIKEVWKVSRVTSHKKRPCLSSFLLSIECYSEEISEYQFVWLQPFASNETGDPINEEFVNEVLFYRKIWGLARTAINKCMLYCDYKFVGLIKAYLEKICVREDELAEKQEATTDQDSSKNVEGNMISIANL